MSGPERVDLKKLAERFSIEELVIAAGSLVLLVALFLDWTSASCSGAFCNGSLSGASGFHGWGWLSFLALVAVAGLLVSRRLLSGMVELPELPASDSVVYMAGGALEIAGVLLFWVEYHDGFSSTAVGGQTFSYGLGFAWFLALLAGIATLVGGYLTSRGSASAPARFSPPHAPAPPPVA
ncbi:MAG: hypothetical protein E6J03_09205 [Chloroflexi bacterium]|nr:MAG: hypothetical protein E6J03_09205 [Chloroflexota bacterium]